MDSVIEYPRAKCATSLDIPLRDSEEVVSIDLENDLPEDPADLRTLLVEESSDKEHWLTIAVAYCNKGMVDAGTALVKMALEVFQGPQSAMLYSFLTWAYLKQAKMNSTDVTRREEALVQAEQSLKSAIEQDPAWIGNMLATIDLYYQRDLYEKALETVEIFIRKTQDDDKRDGKASRSNVLFLLMRAKLLYQKKNYSLALRVFQELLVLDPTLQPDPRVGIGLCFWQLKDPGMAIRSWKRALQMDPQNKAARILVLLGDFRNVITNSENDEYFTNAFTEVLKDLKNLYTEDSHNPVLLTLLQTYYYMCGEYDDVIAVYENQHSQYSQVVASGIVSESVFWCGRAYYAKGDYRKAFSLFQEALRKNEDNLLAKFGLGQSQIQNKLVEESILTFENIYKTHEGTQELNYILGLLYFAKCQTSQFSSLTSKEKASLIERSIGFLEKYVKLTTAKKNQLVTLKAYLVLSELHELQAQYKVSLQYLSKAVEQWKFYSSDPIPVEIRNNLACFHFINGDKEAANQQLQEASAAIAGTPAELTEGITVKYNIARTNEIEDPKKSSSLYQEILTAHPGYVHAKIRSIFLKYLENKADEHSDELEQLLKENESDLEVRSFYSWYAKNVSTTKVDSNGENIETKHNRETLTKYDSHDLYALISLANLYLTIARDTRKYTNAKEQEKSKQSFLKAIQLFQKVLQIDPLNIFAAQGLAIMFAESKRYNQGIEILRKVRDTMDIEDVHMNLANCLLEMKDFTKAIENYELVLTRFKTPENNSTVLNLLGFAWYSRGLKEKSLYCFKKALSYTKEAFELEQAKRNSKLVSSLMFNVAFVELQIAEFLRRATLKDRTLDQLKESAVGLSEAVKLLKELASTQSKTESSDELKQRIQLGEGTIKTALERCIKEQEQYEGEKDRKLAEAKKAMEEEEQKRLEEQKKLEEEERIKREKQAAEFKKLQEEAQKLIEERAILEGMVDDAQLANTDDEFVNEDDKPEKKKKKRKSTKRTKKTDAAPAAETEAGEEAAPTKKRRVAATVLSDDEDDNAAANKLARGKKSFVSEEFINTSDEEDSVAETPPNSGEED
ncbi:HEL198Cp [Eremothecium sinecaudum]|uniref:HEL198Cp n=1 Tax=Eremothecium sinecaudum TaxID=45286 RepID=A0A0X8HTF0_9SACH|nr:HEL198Cp [Eremothecium sinecaudum]AMD21083.1 HEL198Cp [Eremothecium sinecaudum]